MCRTAVRQEFGNLLPTATADPRAKPPAATSTHHLEPWGQPPPPTPFDGGIEELWVKLMGHLRDAANRLRVPQPSPPPPMDSEPEFKALPPPPLLALPQPQADGAARPWNLLQWTRRRPAASMLSAPFLVALTPEEIEEDIYAPPSPSLPAADGWGGGRRAKEVRRRVDGGNAAVHILVVTAMVAFFASFR
nr:zinc finger protein 414-like [Oryza sativa Japonica Group]